MLFLKKWWRGYYMIKLRHWEYWPFGIVQLPAIIYYFWLSLKARSFFFFTASNPSIEMGGLFGESKFRILKNIPKRYVAQSILIQRPITDIELWQQIESAGLQFPLIFKPDLGERGYQVKKINSKEDAITYCKNFRFNFLVQEWINLPLEFGVFYRRFPQQAKGEVFSITGKEFLSVTGDGKKTLAQLIQEKDRAKLQWKKLSERWQEKLDKVINADEKFVLNTIGNHSLGTLFTNCNHLIDEELNQSFDTISKQIPGFYYGRFDLRCQTIEDLKAGRVMIMELNGCGAEPAHIYQPGYSFFKAAFEIVSHWKNIYDIATQNKMNGIAFYTKKEALLYYRKFKEAVNN